VTDKISAIVLTQPTPKGWYLGFAISFGLVMTLMAAITWLLLQGVAIWGINVPVGWGFAIINFVWWIGIGHAGTLISAILLLLRQRWRTSINRFAEAMTIFAVCCAGIFPLIHVGRPWLAYWLLPYPDTMGAWPQFRSPLVWDVFAVSTYATVSLLFWFVGMIPDLATLRDRARHRALKIIYGVLAMGWRGSAVHWHRYEMASLLLAGLATLEFDDFRLHRRRNSRPLTARTCLLGLQACFAVVAVQPHPLGQGALADAHFAGDQFQREAFLQIQLNRFAPDLKRVGVNVRVNRPPRRPPRGAGLLPLPWSLAYTFHR
jgi:hypothetical protein